MRDSSFRTVPNPSRVGPVKRKSCQGWGAASHTTKLTPLETTACCAVESLKISPDCIRRLFEPSFSAMGSNARRTEEDLIYCWEEYLKEMGEILGR